MAVLEPITIGKLIGGEESQKVSKARQLNVGKLGDGHRGSQTARVGGGRDIYKLRIFENRISSSPAYSTIIGLIHH